MNRNRTGDLVRVARPIGFAPPAGSLTSCTQLDTSSLDARRAPRIRTNGGRFFFSYNHSTSLQETRQCWKYCECREEHDRSFPHFRRGRTLRTGDSTRPLFLVEAMAEVHRVQDQEGVDPRTGFHFRESLQSFTEILQTLEDGGSPLFNVKP